MSALMRLTVRLMLGGKKIWVVGFFLSSPILLLAVVLAASGFDLPDEEAEEVGLTLFLYVLYPQSLCILVCLLYGASLLAGEIEDKTLVYLFTRALPRWKVLVAKYLATAASLSVLSAISMSVCYLLAGMPIGYRVWLALLAAVVCACFSYTAIFALLGLAVPRRAIPVGMLYAVLVEFLLSLVPALVNEITASHYLRSLAFHIADQDMGPEVTEIIGGATLAQALIALAVIPLITLTLSAVIVHKRQWPLTEGV